MSPTTEKRHARLRTATSEALERLLQLEGKALTNAQRDAVTRCIRAGVKAPPEAILRFVGNDPAHIMEATLRDIKACAATL